MKSSMKKRWVVLVLVAAMGSGAFAYTFLGAPTAELEQGQFKAGYSFSYAETDIDADDDGFKYTLPEVEINRHFFDLGYGLAEGLELNLLLGTTSLESDKAEASGLPDVDFDFSGSNDFAWGFNAKWTFLDDESIDWGAALQMTWFENDDVVDGDKFEIDGYDMQIAVGPTIDMGGWDLYCGGYYYMFDADLDYDGGSDELEEADDFGGYIGVAFQIMENTDLAVECAFSSDTTAIGANIGWRF